LSVFLFELCQVEKQRETILLKGMPKHRLTYHYKRSTRPFTTVLSLPRSHKARILYEDAGFWISNERWKPCFHKGIRNRKPHCASNVGLHFEQGTPRRFEANPAEDASKLTKRWILRG